MRERDFVQREKYKNRREKAAQRIVNLTWNEDVTLDWGLDQACSESQTSNNDQLTQLGL